MKKLIALVLVLVMALSLVACGAKEEAAAESETPTIDRIKEAGVLVVGTSADYPPYEFHTEIDGKDTIVGFDIAIAQYFADSLGVDMKVVDMNFDSLLISLAEGEFDLVMAGLTPSEERKKAVDFTEVFFHNKQIVIIRAEDGETYTDTASLNGQKVGYQNGTVQHEIAVGLTGEDNSVGLAKFPDLINELKNGTLEAVCTNSLIAAAYVSANEDLMVQDIGIEWENTGFAGAVQKGNTDLVEYIDGVIAEMQEKGLIEQYVAEAQELAGIEE